MVTILESVPRVAPLGLRFWDAVAGAIVRDGLRVVAYQARCSERRVDAVVNRSGVHVFHKLPGLHDLESGEGDKPYWTNLPPDRPSFVVEVTDEDRRFQPCLFEAIPPVRGIFPWQCTSFTSPSVPEPFVPLYSAPTRQVTAGMAVLRAELWNPIKNEPAAWAVIEVKTAGPTAACGYADAAGRIAVIFPYPEPADFSPPPSGGSPPITAGPPLTKQEWTLSLHARYAALNPAPKIPDLCNTLMQPAAVLWANTACTQQMSTEKLKFGKELIVRSGNAEDKPLQPKLFITPTD
jgi:hypothetical protein